MSKRGRKARQRKPFKGRDALREQNRVIRSIVVEPGLRHLVNTPCWGVAAGAGTGSHLSIHLGRKKPRARLLSNETLGADLQQFEGEIMLYVECAWELRRKSRMLCNSRDDNRRGGRMLRGLKQMLGQVVRDVNVGIATLDLALSLEGQMLFQIKCDREKVHPSDDNYSIFVDGSSYIVGPEGQLRVEEMGQSTRRTKNSMKRKHA